jgi:ubiquinone/menaquinone biosynthesis C-methylase UbiE
MKIMATTRTAQSEAYLRKDSAHLKWETDYLNADLDRLYDSAFDRIVASLGVTPGATILDAGCGYCFHAMRLARRGLKVTGVDFSEAALEEARRNVERAGLQDEIRVQKGDLLALPFDDSTFDHVSCWGVLMHIPEIEKVLAEFARVLKPGGKLVLMENAMGSLHVRLWEPALSAIKRLLGRPVQERRRTERGIEEWFSVEDGGLLVRKTDMDWLERSCAALGLRLVDRFPSQFTELYVHLPTPALKKLVYRFNQLWFDRIRSHHGAMGNVLVFQNRG